MDHIPHMSGLHEVQQNDVFAGNAVTDEAVESATQTPYQCLLQEPTASLVLDTNVDPQCASVAILGYN